MDGSIDYELYAETAVQIACNRMLSKVERETALGQLGVVAAGLQSIGTHVEQRDGVLAGDKEAKADIAFLAYMRQSYASFQEAIYATLDVGDADEFQIGKGGYSMVYKMQADQGEYAIKKAEPITILSLVRAFRRAQSLDGVAHLHAINIEQGRAVMDLMPGERISDVSYNEMISAPEEHILRLVDNIEAMAHAGLVIEPTPLNMLYDVTLGFSLIDFQAVNRTGSNDEESPLNDLAVEQVMHLLHTLQHCAPSADTPGENPTRRYTTREQRVALMSRIFGILESHRPDILKRAAKYERTCQQKYGFSFDLIYHLDELPEGEFKDFKNRVEQIRHWAD